MDFERWRWRWVLLLIGIITMHIRLSASEIKREELVSRIAFGSCSNQTAPQVLIDSFSFACSYIVR